MNVALALGGGGVKGNAHIGVLRVLDREGFHVQALAGTSAGGLVGSLYVAGYTPENIATFFNLLDQQTRYRREADDMPSFLGLAGISHLLAEKIGELTFEQLRIPFAVTAVDLANARRVVLRQGSVVEAVLATIAVPGVFPPRRWHGRTLIDGGVLDPVPVNLARSLAPGIPVVAVVLSPHLDDWDTPLAPRLLNSLPFVANYLARLRVAQAMNIFLRSIDIAGASLTDLRLHLDQPDVIIRPDVPQIGLLDDVDPYEVASLGEQAAEAALPELHEAVSWRGRVARRFSRNKFPAWTD